MSSGHATCLTNPTTAQCHKLLGCEPMRSVTSVGNFFYADFCGKRGLLAPEWWEIKGTQYGQLKIWSVSSEGSFIDGGSIGDIKMQDLGLEQTPYVEVRFGIKPDPLNVGGINLFGEKFGNHPQPIVLKVNFAHPQWRHTYSASAPQWLPAKGSFLNGNICICE